MRTAAECHRMGRELAFFSPAHADRSASFNPLQHVRDDDRACGPGPGADAGRRGAWRRVIRSSRNTPLAVVERLGAAQDAVGDGWTIEGLHAVTTMVPPFDDLVARYLYQVLGGRNKHVPPARRAPGGIHGQASGAAGPAGGRADRRQGETARPLRAGDGEPGAGVPRRDRRQDGAVALQPGAGPDLERRGRGTQGRVLRHVVTPVRRGGQPYRPGDPAGPDRLSGAALRA